MEEAAQVIKQDVEEKDTKQDIIYWFRALGKVMNEVGITGFIVLSIVIFIFLCTDQAHKNEITDTWLLFKGESDNPFFIVLVILIIMLIAQQIHYKRVIKMKDERISELANRKSSTYSRMLETRLATSLKKTRKS